MWTPKRIVLLTLGLVFFVAAYIGYVNALGGIDGLTPLPPEFYPPESSPPPTSPVRLPEPTINERLQQAFGPACEELKWPVQLELKSRGLVLVAQSFTVGEGNTVNLNTLSLAVFGKHSDGSYPEINTIKAKEAKLEFDGPVANVFEMGRRKIVNCKLYNDINIRNNRRTPEREDDLTLFVPVGPVEYDENAHHIWTEREVFLKDWHKNEPPTEAVATGMDVFLATERKAPAPNPPPKARGQSGISGAERVVLRSAVHMTLYVDSTSDFLGGGQEKNDPKPPPTAKAPQPPPPAKKAMVTIETEGPFCYNIPEDRARFDVPVLDALHPLTRPPQVVVTRHFDDKDPAGPSDQLICDHLELQFHHRTAPAAGQPAAPLVQSPPPAAGRTPPPQQGGPAKDRELETVHAWGSEVTMKSDTEGFEAHGIDFTHDARQHLSILTGDPKEGMWAIKDGNEIYARELRLINIKDGPRSHTEVTAVGPGVVKTLDRDSGKRPLEAHWTQTLVSNKDDDCDRLILTGDAEFIDPQTEPAQRLQARVIRVWLKSSTAKEARPADPRPQPAAPGEHQGHRLQRLEAEGNVVCDSRQFVIPMSDKLTVSFKDVPAEAFPANGNPVALPGAPAPAPAAAPFPPAPVAAAPPGPADPVRLPGAPPAAAAPEATEPPPRPINLTARIVKATVLRSDQHSVLDKLFADGSVHVIQAPASPEDRGVDIKGATLDLERRDLGNVLHVTGGDDLATLQLDKISISGPEVNIDQAQNKAWVQGNGSMEMLSNANFRGEATKEVVPLIVFWEKNMLFNGQWAEFEGNVQAEQGRSRLLAEHLQVCLDRSVSLKEGHVAQDAHKKPGEKGEPSAKVKTLVCSGKAHIEDATFENGLQVRYQRIFCPELSLDNEDEIMDAFGPGFVYILQPGDESPTAAPQTAPRAQPAGNQPKKPEGAVRGKGDEQMKLTRVFYRERMYGDNKKHLVTFVKDVEVFHLPADNPDIPLNRDRLPAGSMYLRGDQVKVLQVPIRPDDPATRNGTPPGNQPKKPPVMKQEMEAIGHVTVMAQEFYGRADKVKYNEAKEQVIFEGSPGSLAELYKVRGQGLPPDSFRGRRIIYWRTTGAFEVEEARGAEGR